MRTDEGVCPYLVAISLIKGTPFSNREGRSFVSKRGFPCIKETPSCNSKFNVHNSKL
ncbi:hypothetical protein HMPREF0973_02072 [Prevotella veroralis F0319]|uniref:Uncharacterized protein n=1 Tax=Prevotella veroralis F0319 TaxID=649761 RepID=C9MR37_9BACT|nr:hypothetical protein HMPREF0973_02072 [Prevotella veroralis F0319]